MPLQLSQMHVSEGKVYCVCILSAIHFLGRSDHDQWVSLTLTHAVRDGPLSAAYRLLDAPLKTQTALYPGSLRYSTGLSLASTNQYIYIFHGKEKNLVQFISCGTFKA